MERDPSKEEVSIRPLKEQIADVRASARHYRPLLDELRAEARRARARPFPNRRAIRLAERNLLRRRRALREQLSELKGSPVTRDEMDRLFRTGFDRAVKASRSFLASGPDGDRLVARNLRADGTYQIVGDRMVWYSPSGEGVMFNVRGEVDTTAEIILTVSVALEALGFLAAIAGITLPHVDIGRIAARLRTKMTSPAVRRALNELLRILKDAQKSAADKVEAILKFLNALAGAGLISDIIAQIFHDLSWWRIALLVIQFLAQIALFLVPGAALALAAKRAVAIANAVLALVTKGRDLGDMLKSS